MEMNEKKLEEMVRQLVSEQVQFGNVARPKPVRASTSTPASWKKDEAPKASASTQGSWDSTNTPGGVSARTKEKWTISQMAAAVSTVLERTGMNQKTSSVCEAFEMFDDPETDYSKYNF